jgi:hypothetical protein
LTEDQETVNVLTIKLKQVKEELDDVAFKLDRLDMEYRYKVNDLIPKFQDKINELEMANYKNDKNKHGNIESKKKPKITKKGVKEYWRRLSALTHPDKLSKKYSDKQVKQLIEIFDMGKTAYNRSDLVTLKYLIECAVNIRNNVEVTLDSVQTEVSDLELINELTTAIEEAQQELDDLLTSHMYLVYELDQQGKYSDALMLYRMLVADNINILDKEVQDVRGN